jgi:hypothetical protein
MSRRVERVSQLIFVVVVITVVESNIESVFWIFNWVRTSTLQLGAQGGKRNREREKDMQLSAQIELYVFN